MDALKFLIGLHKGLNAELSEADHPKVVTLNGHVKFLTSLLAGT
jgi:hypothetical protein